MTRGQLKLNWYNLTGSDYSWTIWRPDKFNRLFEPCVQPMYKTMTASLSRVLTPLKVTRGSKSSLGPDFNPPEQKIGQVYMVLQLSSFPLLNIYWLCLPSHSLIFFFFLSKKDLIPLESNEDVIQFSKYIKHPPYAKHWTMLWSYHGIGFVCIKFTVSCQKVLNLKCSAAAAK